MFCRVCFYSTLCRNVGSECPLRHKQVGTLRECAEGDVHVEVVKIEVECERAATVCKGRSRGRTDGAKNTRVRFKQRKYVSGQF